MQLQQKEFDTDIRTIRETLLNDIELDNLNRKKVELMEEISFPILSLSGAEILPIEDSRMQELLSKLDEMILFRQNQILDSFRI